MKSQFELTQSREGDLLVLWVEGDFDLAGREPVLDAALAALLESQIVVLDLSKTTFIDASGLGTLVTCRQAGGDRGGRFHVRRAAGQVAYLLNTMGLADLVLDDATHVDLRHGSRPA
jgi:anti-anti-sigma factor